MIEAPFVLVMAAVFIPVWVANKVIDIKSRQLMDAYHDHALTIDHRAAVDEAEK